MFLDTIESSSYLKMKTYLASTNCVKPWKDHKPFFFQHNTNNFLSLNRDSGMEQNKASYLEKVLVSWYNMVQSGLHF